MKPKVNFRCERCKHEFYVPEFTEIIGKNKFKDKYGVLLRCPIDHIDLEPKLTYIDHKKGVPELLGSSGGTFPSEDQFRKEKQKQRKERSAHHFINEELPKINNPVDKAYFTNKYKGKKRKDHEKM